jgi:predicted nucleotidyltransferase
MRFGLSGEDLEILKGLFRDYPGVEKVILYGSRAMGTYRPGSDIDITLIAGGSFSYNDFLHLKGDLAESDLPYFVDVSLFSLLTSQHFIEHIQRVGKILYDRADEQGLLTTPGRA